MAEKKMSPHHAMKRAAAHTAKAEHHHAEAHKWIQSAIKHPGALKKELHVAADKTIPAKKLTKAAKAPGKLGQRARLAETLKGFKK